MTPPQRLAVSCALAVLAMPTTALASPNECDLSGRWRAIEDGNAALVPTDGAFVIHGDRSSLVTADGILTPVTVTVILDDLEVDGTLEALDLHDTILWRPVAPLSPSRDYLVHVTVDNTIADPNSPDCAPDVIDRELVYHVGAGPGGPFTAPEVAASQEVTVTEPTSLEDLVCCDGAYPFLMLFPGYYYYDKIVWGYGTCVNTGRVGDLEVQWTADELTAEYRGMVAWRTVIDGDPGDFRYTPYLYHRESRAFCGHVEILNLADSSTAASPEVCFGAEQSGSLGPYIVEPDLSACVGQPYTCEIVERAWDPEQCVSWPDGAELSEEPAEEPEPATTGYCAVAPRGGGDGLVAIILAGLLRRRREPTTRLNPPESSPPSLSSTSSSGPTRSSPRPWMCTGRRGGRTP